MQGWYKYTLPSPLLLPKSTNYIPERYILLGKTTWLVVSDYTKVPVNPCRSCSRGILLWFCWPRIMQQNSGWCHATIITCVIPSLHLLFYGIMHMIIVGLLLDAIIPCLLQGCFLVSTLFPFPSTFECFYCTFDMILALLSVHPLKHLTFSKTLLLCGDRGRHVLQRNLWLTWIVWVAFWFYDLELTTWESNVGRWCSRLVKWSIS